MTNMTTYAKGYNPPNFVEYISAYNPITLTLEGSRVFQPTPDSREV